MDPIDIAFGVDDYDVGEARSIPGDRVDRKKSFRFE